MRLNKFIALATGMSRRKADSVIAADRVTINQQPASTGVRVSVSDEVRLDGKVLKPRELMLIALNKPIGYVCSREGQGSRTIYDLLPTELHHLKPIGRLDKDSSGLLLLTNDGSLANELTHPSNQKSKVYKLTLDKDLSPDAKKNITQAGVGLEDGLSKFELSGSGAEWTATLHEGRNRQIRRTFEALGYKVTKLHRIQFSNYSLDGLATGKVKLLD